MLRCQWQTCGNEARYVNESSVVTCGIHAQRSGVRISDVPELRRIVECHLAENELLTDECLSTLRHEALRGKPWAKP